MYDISQIKTKPVPLSVTDMIFSENRDRIFTYLTCNDYDWMHYRLIAEFPVGKKTLITVEFEYAGFVTSYMYIQINNRQMQTVYTFDTNLFQKHIKKYMAGHMKAWDQKYAFNGGDLAIDFFNDVIANAQSHKQIKRERISI